jgi:hypothetical protein
MTGVTGEELVLLEVFAGIPAGDLAALAAGLKDLRII